MDLFFTYFSPASYYSSHYKYSSEYNVNRSPLLSRIFYLDHFKLSQYSAQKPLSWQYWFQMHVSSYWFLISIISGGHDPAMSLCITNLMTLLRDSPHTSVTGRAWWVVRNSNGFKWCPCERTGKKSGCGIPHSSWVCICIYIYIYIYIYKMHDQVSQWKNYWNTTGPIRIVKNIFMFLSLNAFIMLTTCASAISTF
jgi:hypothetical protein